MKPGSEAIKFLGRPENQPHRIDAWHLRKTCAILIPVAVEKDARCDIPEFDRKKYQVPGNMTLGEFILFIRVSIRISKKKPIFVSFKNTKPPVGVFFYEIDEENKGEDGFLHITYSGEENVCGSNQEQEHGDEISIEKEAANNPHATPAGIPLKQNIILVKSACKEGKPQTIHMQHQQEFH
ncbi:autophagy-related protein 8B-like [Pyrus communis]|uniref:autophagy-related protein 8B-like n=1 Tax=Pyrus communis TaxID=23211 RepID=UPI0035C03F81